MVLITRKKCNISVDMPTRCFKLCTNCKTRKKKVQNITDTTIVDESIPTFDILNIFYLISEISTYLTAYEVWCLYRTCTEFKNILSDKKIWSAILERDYKLSDISIFGNRSPMKIAYNLEISLICSKCKVFMDKCDRTCVMKYNKISKTECLNYFKLTDLEISRIPHEVKYNNFFKKNITLFRKENILFYVCKKYNGWTNFILFRKNIEHQLALKKIKIQENREKKRGRFQTLETII